MRVILINVRATKEVLYATDVQKGHMGKREAA
jgi:hypothetical protein